MVVRVGEMRVHFALGPRMASGRQLVEFHCRGGYFRGPMADTANLNLSLSLLDQKGSELTVPIQQLGIGTILESAPLGQNAVPEESCRYFDY